jgi:hypothetical protein
LADFVAIFALMIKISFGRTRDFRVKMWGTSFSEDKLPGDLGNVIEPYQSAVVDWIFLRQKN